MVDKAICPHSPRDQTSWRCELWDLADDVLDKCPRELTKQALITLEEATEAYIVEVTAEFHW